MERQTRFAVLHLWHEGQLRSAIPQKLCRDVQAIAGLIERNLFAFISLHDVIRRVRQYGAEIDGHGLAGREDHRLRIAVTTIGQEQILEAAGQSTDELANAEA